MLKIVLWYLTIGLVVDAIFTFAERELISNELDKVDAICGEENASDLAKSVVHCIALTISTVMISTVWPIVIIKRAMNYFNRPN